MEELEEKGKGFRDEHINLMSLFYADDGLILAHSVEGATENLKILM